MSTLFNDIKFALRQLRKTPGFTAAVILVLGLGIGASTAAFSVVNAVLLRPSPYAESDRLVFIYEQMGGAGRTNPSYPTFLDWEAQCQAFKRMATYHVAAGKLRTKGRTERVSAMCVSEGFFDVLGVHPALGRNFLPAEGEPGAARVVMMSHRLWQRVFEGNPNIVGDQIELDGFSYTVIGILPVDFRYEFSRHRDLWLPLDPARRNLVRRANRGVTVLARLRPDIVREQAQVELDLVAQRLTQDYPATHTDVGALLIPLREMYRQRLGTDGRALLILPGIIGFVLLMACLNVASLQLARAAVRGREMTIRAALGASRLGLVRQLFIENLLLGALGGALGLMLATWIVRLVPWVDPGYVPWFVDTIHLHGRTLIYAVTLSGVTGLLCGLAPALGVRDIHLVAVLQATGRTLTSGLRRRDLRRLFVISEIAITLVLLVGAGLMIRSYAHLGAQDPQFNPHNVLTVEVDLMADGPPYNEPQRRVAYFEQVLERIKGLPGVQTVTAASDNPVMGSFSARPFQMPDLPPGKERVGIPRTNVFPDYFRTLQIPLRNGRYLTQEDTASSARVAVINESMARRYWPGENPVGKYLHYGKTDLVLLEIVGVVGDVQHFPFHLADGLERLYATDEPEVYFPYHRRDYPSYACLMVRATGNPQRLMATLHREVTAVDRSVSVGEVSLMTREIGDLYISERFHSVCFGAFALFALILAAVGIYGLLAYVVSQRTAEIGVRMALGAQRRAVLTLVMGSGLKLVLIGIGIGLVGAVALTRIIASLLYGVQPGDPVTFVVVSLFVTGVTLLACYLPARRAARIDPMEALRYE